MKTIAFLFPGQGAQYPGMGLDLFEASPEAKKIFDTAGTVLGRDMVSLLRDSDAETLKRTDVSQIALSAASLAAAACLKERGITPAACAGFSLGEYPALVCAGVISVKDCFRLTEERGRAMQAAVDRIMEESGGAVCSGGESGAPGMAAVIGLAPQQVEALIAEWKSGGLSGLYAANINSPKQVVVSGSAAALAEAETRFMEAGARRFIRLQVAGPFHSPFMKEAAEAFAPTLEQIQFNDPAINLFSNVTGKIIQSGAEAKALALRQITEGVRWTDEEAAIQQSCTGLEACLEVGPGNVLQGLWRDAGSEIPCYAAGTVSDIENVSTNTNTPALEIKS
ncbi:MAG: ACP S-malonyltransferase [Spirochaetaceae bacterium]|jgi:[acyl-carrier-protein] S-malonyltransferase|nr:ACP S-malonyltransferase [Spirochaetaceae bacterium]